MKRQAKRGFTLVELMVVVAILGILVAIAVPVYHASTSKAQTNTCLYNIKSLNSAAARRRMVDSNADTTADDALMETLLAEDYFTAEPTCPAGGVYTCKNGLFSCEIHGFAAGEDDSSSGSTASGIIDQSNQILEEILAEYGSTDYEAMKKYLASKGYDVSKYGHGINEAFRQMMYDLNGGWDSFEVDGKTMYVQPMLNNPKGDKDDPNRVIYYANGNDTPNGTNKWDVIYIYDKTSTPPTWYKRSGGSFNLAGKVWDDVVKDMQDNPDNWKPAPEITIKPA